MGEGGHLPLVSICALVSIYSYNLTVSNGGGGVICLWYLYVHWSLYILITLTVSNRGSFAFGIFLSICSLVSYILIS